MFIQKINFQTNTLQVSIDLEQILLNTQWFENQIGLKHRINASNKFQDCIGSLYSKEQRKFIANELDFTEWSIPDCYIKKQILTLCELEKFNVGRVRFMRLLPKTGLSVHMDQEFRYHLVIKTNINSYICQNINIENNTLQPLATCYHLPNDGYWYKVNTKEKHWVYNGGNDERIHLVVCEG
jgi:hypothetical protein